MRAHDFQITVVDLGEELAWPWPEAPDPRAQRRFHVVAHSEDAVVLQERHVLADGGSKTARVLIFTCDRRLRRQGGVALLFESEKRVGARQLALHHDRFVLPRVWDHLHVAQIPVVVLHADAGRCVLRRGLLVEPRGERVGRLSGALNVGAQGSGAVGET